MTGICGWFSAFLLGAEMYLADAWSPCGLFWEHLLPLYVLLLWEWGQKNSCLFFSCHLWLHFCLSGPLHF